MTARQVVTAIKDQGFEARSFRDGQSTMIQVRLGKTANSISSLMPSPKDEKKQERFIAFMVQKARAYQSDPIGYLELPDFDLVYKHAPRLDLG